MFQHRRLLLLCLCCAVVWMSGCHSEKTEPARIAPGVRMQDVRLYSVALGRGMPYRVFLPERVPDGVRLPVVYLLHGRGPDYHDWSVNSDVSKYALPAEGGSGVAAHGLILVMPEGGESFYVNAAGRPLERWEDYLVHDLPADVERRFPARSDRAGKAILGISMGGFGAVVQGLRHPESYAFVAGLSAAVDVPERRFTLRRVGQWRLFHSIFGPMGSATRAERDPFVLVTKADPAQAPQFYITAGKDEALYEPDKRFAEALHAHGFASEFHALPGGHAWDEWQGQLPDCFARLRAVLREPTVSR
ncbi:MAG TPA: alpha/beta hydrolase family protein [Acidobacteriaceae bacterium]|nr:alpha/beta hydrolase family protein [Acidobacteriaceae bacterium]